MSGSFGRLNSFDGFLETLLWSKDVKQTSCGNINEKTLLVLCAAWH